MGETVLSHFPLLDHAERAPLRDASLDAYAAILPHLADMEWRVLRAVYGLTRWHFSPGDVTGGEVASYLQRPVTTVRPRITALTKRGLLQQSNATRPSRALGERNCHPVWPVLPYDAVLRAEQQRQARQGAA